jgi:hypothetical protein
LSAKILLTFLFLRRSIMSKKLLFLISFVLAMSLAGNVLAADLTWTNNDGAGDRLWSTGTNWSKSGPARAPIAGDNVYIDNQYTDDGNGPIIQAGINAECSQIDMGGNASVPLEAVLTITDGNLLTTGWLDMGGYNSGNFRVEMSGGDVNIGGITYVGYVQDANATINITGGVFRSGGQIGMGYDGLGRLNISGGATVHTDDDLEVGAENFGDGLMNMTSGTVTVEDWFDIGCWHADADGDGHVNLHGGTIEAHFLSMGGGGVGTMDFTEGTLIVDGDYREGNGFLFDPCSDTPSNTWYVYTGTVGILAKRGLITAYNTQVGDIISDGNYPSQAGLRSVIKMDYDVSNAGQTTITGDAVDPNLAWDPSPLDGSAGFLAKEVNLISWSPGENAASHDVYIGTNFTDVDNATTSSTGIYKQRQALADANYIVSTTWGKTYFWRIDEVNASGLPEWKGNIWSFGTDPAWATNPSPGDGDGDVSVTSAILSWDPGPEAVTHQVYFSTDFNDVNDRDPGVRTVVSDPNYTPGVLELETTYYWAVDEVNNLADVNVWPGQVWEFTTAEYITVDDFDSYTSQTDLWNVWDDYWVNGTGSEVFIETDPELIYDGNSLKFLYDNTSKKYTGSRIDADTIDLDAGSDWTGGGVKALWMVFSGEPGNSATAQDRMWVELEDTSSNTGVVIYDGDPNDVKKEAWSEWHIDLALFDACGVSLSNIDRVHIGFGGAQGGQGKVAGGTGTVYFDRIEVWPPYCRTEMVLADITGDCDTDIWDLEILGADWLLYDYNFIAAEPCEANLIGWWKFDEGSGTITVDSSAYNNDGNVIDASWTTGYPGDGNDSGLGFDGDGIGFSDRVVIAERDSNNPGTYPAELMPLTFTIACWTKLDSFEYFGAFVMNGVDDGSDESGFHLYNYGYSDTDNFGLGIRTEAGMYNVETASTYETKTWYHLAATYDDANNVSIYVDGQLAAGPTDVGGPIRWVSADTNSFPDYFTIGVYPYGSNMADWFWTDASIDDVRYYNYAMPQGDVVVLAEQVTPGTEVYQPVPSVANITDLGDAPLSRFDLAS